MNNFFIILVLCAFSATGQQVLIPFNKEGKFGYLNQQDKIVIQPAYESANVFVAGLGVVKQNGKYGVIDERGNWVVKPAYDGIWINDKDSVLTVRKANGKGFLRLNGQPITPVKYYSVDGFDWGVARVFQQVSHPQAVNKAGKELIPATHFFEGQPFRGFMKVYDRATEKVGIIDSTGKFYLPCRYDEVLIQSAETGKFIVVNRSMGDANNELKHYGLAGPDGMEIIPVRFKEIRYLGGGLFGVKVDDKWGVLDEQGKVLLEDEYLDVQPAGSGHFFFATLTANGLSYGLMNKDLKVVVAPMCLDVKIPYQGSFVCRKETGWGVVDFNGKTLVPFEYLISYGDIGGNPNNYNDDYIWAKKNNRCFLYDRQGQLLTSFPNTDYLFIHPNGLISYFDSNKKLMVADKNGKQLFTGEFQSFITFDKLVLFKKESDSKWYLVTETGLIINEPYDEIDDFSRVDNFIRVRRADEYFYIDSTGKEYIFK